MEYSELLTLLNAEKEKEFAKFQCKLIPTDRDILGVRTPTLRKIAKQYTWDVAKLLAFPDDYYEVVFIKLTVVSLLPYEQFVLYVETCVSMIDNWALCDSFKAKCIRKRKADFLLVLDKLYTSGHDFAKRYVLVTLLFAYMEEKYLPIIERYIRQTDTEGNYYLHMAVAWLTAELLVHYPEKGIAILENGYLAKNTHNKAIQKAIESYRIDTKQKEFLRSLKIK